MPQKHKNAEHYPLGSDDKDWPELEPAKSGPTSEQALAETVAKMRAENVRKRLVTRSRALLAVVVLALLSVVQGAFHVIPALVHGEATILLLLPAYSMVLQLSASAYFLTAREPESAAQVLKLLFILNSLMLLIDFFFGWLDYPLLTLASLVSLFIAHKKMERLKYDA